MRTLKLAFRTLAKAPIVTSVAIVSLALGIGANTAIYSLFDQMLLRSLPVEEPGLLVNLANPGPKPGSQWCSQIGNCSEAFSHPMFRDLEQQATASFAGLATHADFGANLAIDAQTVNGQGLLVSGSYFPVLGVRPALGRLLTRDDDRVVGQHFVAVLSHRFWQNQLGGDPSVLNAPIVVNGQHMTIVGVAARGFEGTTLGNHPDVFVPIRMHSTVSTFFDEEQFDNRRMYWMFVFGRLKPGVPMEQGSAEVNTIYSGILNDVEAELQSGMSEATMEQFRAKTLLLSAGQRGQSTMRAEVSIPLTMLFAITGVVLLIACANIANLLLARGANRAQEMAIRGSLGASRRSLVTQLLTESILLAAIGGVASILVAQATIGLISSMLPPESAGMLAGGLRPSVIVFAAALSVGTGLLFGMYPALHSTRPDLVTVLRGSSGQPSGARAAARFRSVLVTSQIALSMTLLVAAGLFIRSLANVSRLDLGLTSENVITFGLSPVLNGYASEDSKALFDRVEEELMAIPGVTDVSAALVPVLSGRSWGNSVSVDGFERGPDTDVDARFNEVGPGYFSTLEIPLMAGREFSRSDDVGAQDVAIVNQAFARKFGLYELETVGTWMGQGGIDTELDIEIVGLVRDAKYNDVKQAIPPMYFRPYRQDADLGFVTFYVKTVTDPDPVLRAIPALVKNLDANLPVEDLKTLEQQARESVLLDRVIGILSTAFAALATLLAAVGLYGVLAYTVAQRTREFGLRMALGSDGGRIRGLVLRQVGLMTLIGSVVGILAAFGVGRAAQSILFGMEGFDPVVVALVTVLLASVAIGAGYLPALRASKVDPMKALRYE